MTENNDKARFRLEKRTTKAAEKAAQHAAEQAAAAREQSATAKRADRKTPWVITATVLAAVVGVICTFVASHYADDQKAVRTYSQQIVMEVAIARRLKAIIGDIPGQLGPGSHRNAEEVRSAARQDMDILSGIDQDERNHELHQDVEPLIDGIYLARREIFYRIGNAIRGAVIQADYQEAHPFQTKARTTNYILGTLNADMTYNLYVHAVKDAADAHHISFPHDLWIVSPNFTGPMIDDSN